MLLHGIQVALDGLLWMLPLEFGDHRRNQCGAEIALNGADVLGEPLHELALLPASPCGTRAGRHSAALQVLPLGVSEALDLLWRHRTPIPQRDEGHIPCCIGLEVKALFLHQTMKCFLDLPDFLLVFLSQLALLAFEGFLPKRLGQGLAQVRHQTYHVLLQTASLPSMEAQGLGLVGIPKVVHIHPVARGGHRGRPLTE